MIRSLITLFQFHRARRRAIRTCRPSCDLLEDRLVPAWISTDFSNVPGGLISVNGSVNGPGQQGGKTFSFTINNNPYVIGFVNYHALYWGPTASGTGMSLAGSSLLKTFPDSTQSTTGVWQRNDIPFDSNRDGSFDASDSTVVGRLSLTTTGTTLGSTAALGSLPDSAGAVAPVVGDYSANFIFDASSDGVAYEPADDFYANHSAGAGTASGESVKSFTGGFWYDDSPIFHADSLINGLENDGQPDHFVLSRNGNDDELHINGSLVYRFSLALLNNITINGSGDKDTLTIDGSSGDPLPAGTVTFNGGSDTDTLEGNNIPAFNSNPTSTPSGNYGGKVFFTNVENVPQINQPPLLSHIPDQTVTVGNQMSFTAQAQDPEGGAVTFSLAPGAPAGASINPTSGLCTWMPSAAGNFSITVRATDNGSPAQTASQAVSITVNPAPTLNPGSVNQPPVITLSSGPLSVPHHGSVVISSAGAIAVQDPDAGSSPIQATVQVDSGTLQLAETSGLTAVSGNGSATLVLTGSQTAITQALNSLQFVAASGFAGSVHLTLTTDDLGNTGSGGSKTATSSVDLVVLDQPPVMNPSASKLAQVSVRRGGTLAVDVAHGLRRLFKDSDGDPLTFRLARKPAHGQVRMHADGSYVFVPARNFHGRTTFVVQAFDGTRLSRPVTITVNVKG